MGILHNGKPLINIIHLLYYAQLLIPDFALILIGYLLCRFTALDRSVWSQIEKLVFYFLFPVLLFSSIVKSPIHLGEVSNFISAGLVNGCLHGGIGLCLAVFTGV